MLDEVISRGLDPRHTGEIDLIFESLAEDVACGPGMPVGPYYRNTGSAIRAEEKG